MTRQLRRPLAAAFVVLVALTGCQAGPNAETSQDYNGADGRNVNVPEDAAFDDDYIAVRNALVVGFGENAALNVTLINRGAEGDVLEEAVVGDTPVEIDGAPIDLTPGEPVRLGLGSDTSTSIQGADLAPGQWTTLTLTFASAGSTTLDLLVVAPGDEYATEAGSVTDA